MALHISVANAIFNATFSEAVLYGKRKAFSGKQWEAV
jgi:hypothetical protein